MQAVGLHSTSTNAARIPAYVRCELSEARRRRVPPSESAWTLKLGDDAAVCELDDRGFASGTRAGQPVIALKGGRDDKGERPGARSKSSLLTRLPAPQ